MVNFTRKDRKGERFGNLTVIDFGKDYGKSSYKLLCQCDCGVQKEIARSSLTSGLTKSCCCLFRKHGMRNTRFYACWNSMKNRCKSDKHYISSGISYDSHWEEFLCFFEDMYESYKDDLELDRVDSTKDYSKENCRWSTESVQAFNQGKTKLNTSGRTGVYYLKDKGKWRASITFENNVIYLYQGSSFEKACKKREEAEIKYFGKVKE